MARGKLEADSPGPAHAAVVGDRAVEAAETFQDAFDRMTAAGNGRAVAK